MQHSVQRHYKLTWQTNGFNFFWKMIQKCNFYTKSRKLSSICLYKYRFLCTIILKWWSIKVGLWGYHLAGVSNGCYVYMYRYNSSATNTRISVLWYPFCCISVAEKIRTSIALFPTFCLHQKHKVQIVFSWN